MPDARDNLDGRPPPAVHRLGLRPRAGPHPRVLDTGAAGLQHPHSRVLATRRRLDGRRSTVDRYLRLLLSERPLRSFDALQEDGGASMLVEVFTHPASMTSERSGTPLTGTRWDWTLEQAGVLLSTGLPGLADEDVAVRVRGAGMAEPSALELAATRIEPYLDGREVLLAAHPSR